MALQDYYNVDDNGNRTMSGTNWAAQRFYTNQAYTITSVILKLYKGDSETTGTVTVSIRSSTPTGADLCSGTIEAASLVAGTPGSWVEITFDTPYELEAETAYCIVVRLSTGVPNYIYWRHDTTDGYRPGSTYFAMYSSTSGSGWNNATYADMMFETYGDAVPSLPSKPTTPTPANNATEVDFSGLTISWVNGGGATSYDVYMGQSGSLSLISEGQAGTSLVVDFEDVPYNKKIYWRVDAVNDAGTTTGDDWNFDARPGKVATTTPAHQATGINLNATTGSWEAPSGVTGSYNIYYGTLSGFLSLVDNTEVLELALIDGPFPHYGEIYYWRVDTVNDFGITQGDELYFTALIFDPVLPHGLTLVDGEPTGTPDGWNNMITVKRLVAAAQNALWYENL